MLNTNKFEIRIFLFFLFCTLIIFFFSSKFSPLYNFNYWSDINIYYTIGKGIWHNKIVYKDLFDHKGPLIFFIYSVGYILSPGKFWGMFIVQSCFQTVALFYSYKILNLFTQKKKLSIILSLFIFYFLFIFNLDGGSAEEFIFVFEIVSFYYCILYFKDTNYSYKPIFMFVNGVMVASVFYIKLNMIFFSFFPILFIFIYLLRYKQYKNLLQNFIALVLGILLVSFFIVFYFLFNNAISDLWGAYIEFNKLYADQIGFDFKIVLSQLYSKIKTDYIFFIFISLGLFYAFFSDIFAKRVGFISFVLSFCLMILITIPGSVDLHYYLIPLVPFCLFGFILIISLYEKILFNFDLNRFLFAFLLFISVVVVFQKKNLFYYTIENLLTRNFPITSVEKFSQNISSNDGNSLLVLDISQGICVFTTLDITPDIKYFFSPNISHSLFPEIRIAHTNYIKNGIVKYVIVDSDAYYLPYYSSLLYENYDLIDEYPKPQGGSNQLLFKRK